MNIFICDDDAIFADKFSKIVQKSMSQHQIHPEIRIFLSPAELLDAFSQAAPCDVLFLDIDMPHMNGLDLAFSLKAYTEKPYLIFVSSVESLVYQSFKVNPFWFIRKRFCETELEEVIHALLADMQMHLSDTISINCSHSLYKIYPKKICYIECQNKTLHIHYAENPQILSIPYTLSAIEKQLTPYGFLRVHKGFLVNYHYIFTLNRQSIILDNGDTIPISKYRLQEVRRAYGRLLC